MTNFDQWAGIYDWVFAEKLDDVPFYVEEAVASGGPVLELGSGTGRITLPIAQSGVEIVGLESSMEMLKVARAESAALEAGGRITWAHGDMRDFSLGREFALVIIPFRGFLSLLSCRGAAQLPELRKVPPGARRQAGIRRLRAGSGYAHGRRQHALPLHGRTATRRRDVSLVIWHQNRFDNHNQVNSARTILDEVDSEGEVVRRLYREFQIRYMHRFEAQHLLELCGFLVEELYGDFDRNPFDETSEEMVWIATPDL